MWLQKVSALIPGFGRPGHPHPERGSSLSPRRLTDEASTLLRRARTSSHPQRQEQ